MYHHDGSAYEKYKLKVQNIIIRNIANVSDAYTYVKSHIKRDNGSRDINTIRGRYENSAMHEKYTNEASRNLETVAHINKRAMKFEMFVAKFTQAVDEL